MRAPTRDPDLIEQALGPNAALRGRDARPEERRLHVHASVVRGQQVVRLEDDAHDVAPVGRWPPEVRDVLARPGHGSLEDGAPPAHADVRKPIGQP